jgi:hypothetical protein
VDAGAIRALVPLLTDSQSGQPADSAVKLLSRVSELEAGREELMTAGVLVPVLELLMVTHPFVNELKHRACWP